MTFTDEMLSAYLDGELSDAQCGQLESAMKHDEVLRERLESFAAVDIFLQDGLSLIDTYNHEDLYVQAKSPAIQHTFARRHLPKLAIAACALIAIGIVTVFPAYLSGSQKDSELDLMAQTISKHHVLYPLLENTLSANYMALGENTDLAGQVILSFRSQGGQLCRHFQLEQSSKFYEGVGCRSPQNWRVELIARTAHKQDASAYRTASTSGLQAVETHIDDIIAGLPLTLEDERMQIQSDWGHVIP